MEIVEAGGATDDNEEVVEVVVVDDEAGWHSARSRTCTWCAREGSAMKLATKRCGLGRHTAERGRRGCLGYRYGPAGPWKSHIAERIFADTRGGY